MKIRIAAIALVLASGVTVQSQQRAEWRPNIADDNKAATLDETTSFLKGIASTAENADFGVQGDSFVRSFERQDRCSLRVARSIGDNGVQPYSFVSESIQIDLSAIDPLLVSFQYSEEPKTSIPYFVTLFGTNNAQIVQGERARYSAPSGKTHADLSSGAVPCMPGKTRKGKPTNETSLGICVNEHIADYKMSFPFGNEETAKRFARALMHAALLCGGTKAISPF